MSGFAADDPAGAGIDIDDDDLAAVHEFQLVEHPPRVELRPAQIGHVVIGRARADVGDQLAQRDHLSLRRRFAQIVTSEEHTSELQSLMRISYAVFCLKKKK